MAVRLPLVLTNGLLRQAQATDTIDLTTGVNLPLSTGVTGTLNASAQPALTGDVTNTAGSLATTIAAGAVTLAKQAAMATASVVYRKTAAAGPPEVQTLATLKTDLGLTGTNSGDQTTVQINGTVTSLININDTTPVTVANGLNVKWQRTAGSPDTISAYVPLAVQSPAASTDRNITTWNGTTGALLRSTGVNIDATDQIKPVANTATVAPILLTGGTVNTTPQVGAIEYGGLVPYFSGKASQRGYLQNVQYCVLSSPYTLVSQTAPQKLFNASTNGAVTLPIGTYRFTCNFQLTALSASSNQIGFALGGAATFTQTWNSIGSKNSGLNTGSATALAQEFNTAAQAGVTMSDTNTAGTIQIYGIIRVTVSGTIIPQVSMTVASAGIVQTNSFFEVWAIDESASTTKQGNWS